MFANRLRKTHRHRRKWARRNDVACYRLYNRDIPEVPLVVDWYDGRLYVAWVVKREERSSSDSTQESWVEAMASAGAEALGVGPEDVFVKERRRQKGDAQYERLDRSGERFAVPEGGLRFLVNLRDYLDTGLFLDHRQTRAMLRAEAEGTRFLNLFAYTGAFTVYAADGGAASTTTVDLSKRYLAWAEENLALNGLDGPAHRFVRDDVFAFLEGTPDTYDLALLDPPTFSNSKRMDRTLDVRRDHRELIEATLAVMPAGGVLYFSSNARGEWALETDGLPVDVEDVTDRTVPPDFDRRRPHRCWRMVKT